MTIGEGGVWEERSRMQKSLEKKQTNLYRLLPFQKHLFENKCLMDGKSADM